MPDPEPVNKIRSLAAKPSLIESFSIEGLHGYRSIALESEYAATILIARNGTGKTTLLGALDAFLRMQFSRFRNLEFTAIKCKFRDVSEEITLHHDDIMEFLQPPSEGEMIKLANRANIDPGLLFNFLIDEWENEKDIRLTSYDNKITSEISSAFNYNSHEIWSVLSKAKSSLFERQPSISKIRKAIESALQGIDIVYLPTYRRVEVTLRGDSRETAFRRRRPKIEVAEGSLFTGEIQFGLTDILVRLSQLEQKIVLESNIGYRDISGNIINELLDGSFEKNLEPNFSIPSQEELTLFFKSIARSQRDKPLNVLIPNLGKIYTRDGTSDNSSKFLKYFLSKLNTPIQATKDVEFPINDFIDNCNKYLYSPEPSTNLDEENKSFIIDGKKLRLNRKNLQIHVESLPEERKIPLEALSSGEKQMISLFAKIFLYPRRKIVLIDEPELSLSMDWQKEILVDVISAPLCEQLIAITHSPFVFDNELGPFAKAIKLGTASVKSQPTDADADALESDPDE